MFDGMHLGHITLINALKQRPGARHQRSAIITFQAASAAGGQPSRGSPSALMTLDKKIEAIRLPQPPTTFILLDFNEELVAALGTEFMEAAARPVTTSTLW